MAVDWNALGIAASGVAVAVNSYWTKKVQRQTKPSNGKKLATIVEEIRDNVTLIKADVVTLKRNHAAMAQDFATHVVDDDVHQRHTDEAFRQLGVSQPPGSHAEPTRPGRRK